MESSIKQTQQVLKPGTEDEKVPFASLSVSAIDSQVLAFGFADLLRWEFQHLLEPEQEEQVIRAMLP